MELTSGPFLPTWFSAGQLPAHTGAWGYPHVQEFSFPSAQLQEIPGSPILQPSLFRSLSSITKPPEASCHFFIIWKCNGQPVFQIWKTHVFYQYSVWNTTVVRLKLWGWQNYCIFCDLRPVLTALARITVMVFSNTSCSGIFLNFLNCENLCTFKRAIKRNSNKPLLSSVYIKWANLINLMIFPINVPPK